MPVFPAELPGPLPAALRARVGDLIKAEEMALLADHIIDIRTPGFFPGGHPDIHAPCGESVEPVEILL